MFGLKPNDGASLLPPSAAPAGSPAPPSRDPKDDKKKDNKIVVESGFDPTALERGAKAMRELDASANGKLALELSAQQERTRQIELQVSLCATHAFAAAPPRRCDRRRRYKHSKLQRRKRGLNIAREPRLAHPLADNRSLPKCPTSNLATH